ncbi:complement component C1q receptor [Peromyscus leucopus]|uniref:complement component C1q receptor n=1 Tax=Peromyscus leucopus TaxID=10041 RepID=UPI0010A193C4|nr:complement component C1q receptor [Peromyscus leucopus]
MRPGSGGRKKPGVCNLLCARAVVALQQRHSPQLPSEHNRVPSSKLQWWLLSLWGSLASPRRRHSRMATSTALLLLLLPLLGQPRAEAAADSEAVVCQGTACYTAHWGKLSAAEAQHRCNENGGNLATVKSEEEARNIQQALAQLLKTKEALEAKMGKFWIGLQREKGKCTYHDLPMKGFSWVGGGEDTAYSNWYKESKRSCTSKRCVSLILDLSLTPHPSHLPKWYESPCGTPDDPGKNIEGFLCKFNFKGMCSPLALGGPGQVTYTTPFQATTSSLEAVPFASAAKVACGDKAENKIRYFICNEKTPGIFHWGSSGPLCVSPEFGCSFNNGGCQQDCFEGGDGSFRCGCRPGFRLLDDLVTCASRNPCSSDPCTGGGTCHPVPLSENYTCQCPNGYQLDSSQVHCVDIDECQDSPCAQGCINTPGGFQCECWVGYQSSGPKAEVCEDVDECAHSPCAHDCVNTVGSFHCSCKDGYALSGEDSTQCEDIDECLNSSSNPCDTFCFNSEGSFSCGCLPGWELAPNGVSCIKGIEFLEPPTKSPQKEGKGDRKGSTVPPSEMPSSSRGSENVSKGGHTTDHLSLPSDTPNVSVPPKISVPSEASDVWMELSTHLPTATGHSKPTHEDSVAAHSDSDTDGQKLLLFYILGTVVAISLLLALALGLLIYRKRRAKKEEIKEKKPQNAADSYSWVPERAESRALENQYSPAPGTDC